MIINEDAVTPDIAEGLARAYLASALPQRWAHTCSVATRARTLGENANLSEPDVTRLEISGWFHDIGYATASDGYPWHPVAGALMLRQWGLPRYASMVAWHSTSVEEAARFGPDTVAMLFEFPEPDPVLADLLTYADMTTSPTGELVTMAYRRDEVIDRHGPDSTAALAMVDAWPRLRAVEARVRILTGETAPIRLPLPSQA